MGCWASFGEKMMFRRDHGPCELSLQVACGLCVVWTVLVISPFFKCHYFGIRNALLIALLSLVLGIHPCLAGGFMLSSWRNFWGANSSSRWAGIWYGSVRSEHAEQLSIGEMVVCSEPRWPARAWLLSQVCKKVGNWTGANHICPKAQMEAHNYISLVRFTKLSACTLEEPSKGAVRSLWVFCASILLCCIY